jgi:hypothetical protein
VAGGKFPPHLSLPCFGRQTRDSFPSYRLKRLGFWPWLGEVELTPGVELDTAIETTVHNSHVILVCVSRASITKVSYVQKEIHFALERALEMPEGQKYIVPVRLEECELPKCLRKWHAVNLFSNDGESRLVQALREKASDLDLLSGT